MLHRLRAREIIRQEPDVPQDKAGAGGPRGLIRRPMGGIEIKSPGRTVHAPTSSKGGAGRGLRR
ncbi:hypothetical protein GCM10011415_21770 [Salipiger pallidus]|uniref:Uncharacterized protein n=1 Tax=Salipiger pallidus TaxID=1775170 RepID=A0A8J3EFY1_9RHOB|nr:hypothetical protein GCM10011415_21770 [Salipiger pallidus]